MKVIFLDVSENDKDMYMCYYCSKTLWNFYWYRKTLRWITFRTVNLIMKTYIVRELKTQIPVRTFRWLHPFNNKDRRKTRSYQWGKISRVYCSCFSTPTNDSKKHKVSVSNPNHVVASLFRDKQDVEGDCVLFHTEYCHLLLQVHTQMTGYHRQITSKRAK